MVLSVQDLEKTWPGGVRAVDGVSFDLAPGELLALVGESGCGKTTTLKMINRLLEPSGGRIVFEGRDIAGSDPVALRRRMGWVMQGDGLFPHMSVTRNIAVTPQLNGWDETRIKARIAELLELVRLDPSTFADRLPGSLSGGQRQRVGVARALAAEPPLLLMDEPFGALDPLTRDELRRDFQELRAPLGFAAILVTHDLAEALLMADRIAVMEQGRLLQIGTPRDLLSKPAGPVVERLVSTPLEDARAVERLAGEARS